ncbi:putative transcription factor interactor and regulator CCHC(Zn) family [Helianthus annuus]|uniref:Transcription factor interactor and regulator CCHC(Zn) family n=1 Tax=Helianthus annuus TaxID=4232 RepID=A0A251USL6_HELAN|nr:putative transcription factor interactor and regulator CCHC(Zn) family [Helianthus annuus]
MVYGHCNRCGIGHLPSQCPNQSGPRSAQAQSQANFASFSETGSTSGATWFPDTGANSHASPDLSNLDNSEVYQGRVFTHYPSHGSK